MEKINTKIDCTDFGKSLAHSDSVKQAELINSFAYELKIICRDSDLTGTQPCSISEKLDSNGIDLIKSLFEFIKLREKNKVK